MSAHQTDVLIIGGGPAGLAAGIAARQKGFSVTIADACHPPIDKACGEGLLGEGVISLRRLGVSLTAQHGAPLRGIRFVESEFSAEALFPGEPGLGIRRTVLHGLLAERAAAAGVNLLWGKSVQLNAGGPSIAGSSLRAHWIIGADGQSSLVRRWASLEARHRECRRFGVRRHFRVPPWSDLVEVHWASECQAYITPVGPQEISVALLSRDRHLRFEDFWRLFPELARRLADAPPASSPRGAATVSCRLRAVVFGSCALVGEASGSLDAITGQGLSLAFRQALALSEALEQNNLQAYAAEHRAILASAAPIERVLLLLDRYPRFRRQVVFRALAARPRLFSRLLALHAGEWPPAPAKSPHPEYV